VNGSLRFINVRFFPRPINKLRKSYQTELVGHLEVKLSVT